MQYSVQWVSCMYSGVLYSTVYSRCPVCILGVLYVHCTVGEGFGTLEALQGCRVQGGARGDSRACHDDDDDDMI